MKTKTKWIKSLLLVGGVSGGALPLISFITSNNNNNSEYLTFNDIYNRVNQESTTLNTISFSKIIYKEINWYPNVKDVMVGAKAIINNHTYENPLSNLYAHQGEFLTQEEENLINDPELLYFTSDDDKTWKNNYKNVAKIIIDLSNVESSSNWINTLKTQNIKFLIAKSDFYDNVVSYTEKDITDIFDLSFINNLKNELNKRKYASLKYPSMINDVKLKHMTISFNLNVLLTHSWEFSQRNGRAKITNVQANIEIQYEHSQKFQQTGDFISHMKNVERDFNNSDLKNLKSLTIQTDVGATYGLTDNKIASDDKSNKEYFENKLKNSDFFQKYYSLENKNQLEQAYRASLKYEIYSDNKKVRFWYEFYNPQVQKWEKILLKDNIDIYFQNTNKFANKNLANRLRIIPSKFVDITQPYSRKLVVDKPIRIDNDKELSNEYGGTWIYHAPAKIRFLTTLREDEVLLINSNKIDVLDRKFEYDLKDLRNTTKQNKDSSNNKDNDNEQTNKYEIEILKYDKSNVNETNENVISRYKVILIINSLGNDLQGKWYAWNPEIDPKQRELIEPYLKKENGEYLLDQNNNKIPNPKYDPLINPKTGTKEEILWVNYSKFNLPKDTRFLQDPRDKQGNFIHIDALGRPTLLNGDLFDIELGFIAQGSVVGKGINVSSNSEIEQAKRFFISSNLQDSTFDTNIDNSTNTSSSGNKINISKNENDYFSSSGLWMYTIRDKGNIDTYKLFLIGKNEPSALFSQVYSNPSVIPFWSSYHGKNLAKFLIDNNYVSEQKLSSLKYEEVINYWKIYVSSTYKFVYGNEDNEEDNSYIHGKKISDNSIILPKDKITLTPFVQEDQLKEFAKTISEKDFSKYNKQHWEQYAVIAEKAKDKIDFDVESKNNEIVYSFYFKEESFNSLFTIKKSVWNVAVKWKEDVEFENTTQKVEITPSINGSYLSSITETAFDIQDVVANIDRVRLLDFNDSDKVNFDITIPFNNVLRFEFNVKRSYQNNYFISREKQFIYVDLNDIFVNLENKYINIFSNFNLTNLNLNGETDFLKAKNIILKAIENAINKQYKYKIDFDIENFDNVVKNAIKVISTLKDPIYFDLYLNSINTTNNNLVGRRRISLTNSVKNNFIPSNVNLINYSISNIELKQITTFKELYSEIIKNIDNDLRAYRVNFNDYLTIENVSELEKLLTPNKINTINLKLRPLNNILKGTKTVKITNDLISITETDLTLNKDKNKYTKEQLQELKDKLEKSKNSDFDNKNEEETAKNEWEDGFVAVRNTDKNNNSEDQNNIEKETLRQKQISKTVGISFSVIFGIIFLGLIIAWAIKTKFWTKFK